MPTCWKTAGSSQIVRPPSSSTIRRFARPTSDIDMELFVTRLIEGLASGSLYALVAITLVVVYRATGHLNFAQGEMAMFGAYSAYLFWSAGLPLVASLIIAVGASFVVGYCMQMALIGPLSRRPDSEFAVVILTVAVFLGIDGLVVVIWGANPHQIASVFPGGADKYISVSGARIFYDNIGIMLTLAL